MAGVCVDDETDPAGEVSWFQGCVAVGALAIMLGGFIAALLLLGPSGG